LQFRQLDRQPVVVPVGKGRSLIVREPIRLGLGRAETFGGVDGDLLEAQLLGRLESGVADEQRAARLALPRN
jgi:hypothetical protein